MVTRALAFVGGGFLLAVLWFDLKFDLLALDALIDGTVVPAEAISTIQTYYGRALFAEGNGFPLIACMMLLALVGVVTQLVREQGISIWPRIMAVALSMPPILLAGARIIPNANSLTSTVGDPELQTVLAKSVLVDHIYCFASIACFLLLQLWIYRSVSVRAEGVP